MKKRISILIIALCSMVGLKAQSSMGYGTSFVNPQLTNFDFSVITKGSNQGYNIGFNIGGGHYFSENMAFIGTLGINSKRIEGTTEGAWIIAGGIRITPFANLSFNAQLGYQRKTISKKINESIPLILDASYSFFVGRSFAVEPGFYWQYGFLEKRQQFGVKVGFGIYF